MPLTNAVKPAAANVPPPAGVPDAPVVERAGISLRAWIIGLLLIPVLVFWVEYTEIVAEGPDLAAMSLPMASVFALFVLILINAGIIRLKPQWAFTQPELLVIYTMNTIAVYISGIGMMQFLPHELVGWSHYATPANNWAHWQHFVRGWAVPNTSVIDGYYIGRTTFFNASNLAGWSVPILVWTAFIFVLLFCMYCIAALMRRQWVDSERLTFPIVQIPIEITKNGGNTPFWRNRLLWIGIAIPAILETINTIHFTVLPALPYIPIKPEIGLEFDQYFTTPPWNSMGYTTLSFYPMVIGLTYLLAQDVSFSCWAFYLGKKAETILATALGLRDAGAGTAALAIPYTNEQALGAFIGVAFFSLWMARPALKAAWRHAFCGDRSIDDTNEPMAYRTAIIGVGVSALLLVVFGVALGLSPLLSVVFFLLFFLMALTFTRIRAEAGLPWGQGPWGLAHVNIVSFAGSESITPQEATGLAFVSWFDTDWRCLAQPAMLESMKMADMSSPKQINPRKLTAVVLVATVVGTLAAWASVLGIYYHIGADSAAADSWRSSMGHSPFDQEQSWLSSPQPLSSPRFVAAAAGFVIVAFLSVMRTRFVWWPLHPIGFAVANTGTMDWIWFAMFIGWACKALILRYGGIKLYRTCLPFFYGLVIGDYGISGIWSLVFLATGHHGYRTFPI